MPRWEHAPTHCNKGAKTTLGVWHVTFLSVPLLARACPLVCECYTGNISAFDGGAKIQTNGSFVQAYLRTYTTVRESFFLRVSRPQKQNWTEEFFLHSQAHCGGKFCCEQVFQSCSEPSQPFSSQGTVNRICYPYIWGDGFGGVILSSHD